MGYEEAILWIGRAIEGAGVLVIAVGVIVASVRAAIDHKDPAAYMHYRKRIGRAILLGLELLVAGDIIRTVTLRPSLTSAVVLAIIVLIRTFLSASLQLEIEGRWPWQRRDTDELAGDEVQPAQGVRGRRAVAT